MYICELVIYICELMISMEDLPCSLHAGCLSLPAILKCFSCDYYYSMKSYGEGRAPDKKE